MHEAIDQYIEREEKHETFPQDVLKAWQNYQKTGLHVIANEVDAWLGSWGTGHELPAPICHT